MLDTYEINILAAALPGDPVFVHRCPGGWSLDAPSGDLRWQLMRMEAGCPGGGLIPVALVSVLDDMGLVPAEATSVCLIEGSFAETERSMEASLPDGALLRGIRLDGIVDPDDEFDMFPRLVDSPATRAYASSLPEGLSLAAAGLRIAASAGVWFLEDIASGKIPISAVSRLLSTLPDEISGYSMGRLELPVSEAISLLPCYGKEELALRAAIELPAAPGTLEEEMNRVWRLANRCWDSWEALGRRAFGMRNRKKGFSDQTISALERFGILDAFVDGACSGASPEALVRAAVKAVEDGIPLDDAAIREETRRIGEDMQPFGACAEALPREDAPRGSWGELEELLEEGWRRTPWHGLRFLAADADGLLSYQYANQAGGVRGIAEMLPDDGWSIVLDEKDTPWLYGAYESLFACLSLAGKIPGGFGRCACMTERFYRDNIGLIERQVSEGRAVIVARGTGTPEAAGLDGIAFFDWNRCEWKLSGQRSIAPGKLSGLSELVAYEELQEALEARRLPAWSPDMAEVISFGNLRSSLLRLRPPYDEAVFCCASTDSLRAVGLLDASRVEDAACELEDLVKIWTWTMGKAGFAAPGRGEPICWKLVQEIMLPFGIDSMVEAYYSGIQVEDLIGS